MNQETRVQSSVESYQRLKKMVLDASLLDTQHYKVRMQSMEWRPPLHFGVASKENGVFGLLSTTVGHFMLIYFINMEC